MSRDAEERSNDVDARSAPANGMPAGYWRTLGPAVSRDALGCLGPQDDAVDAIVDVDVADAQAARGLSFKMLPGIAPTLLVHYRDTSSLRVQLDPISSGREFENHCPMRYSTVVRHIPVATFVRSGVVTVEPLGPIGAISVRLRPEAAPQFLGGRMDAFANVKVCLADVFKRHEVSALEERVAQARTSIERITVVRNFMRAQLRERDSEPLVSRAAKRLRLSPNLRIHRLAEELGVGERNLSRRFRSVFGVSPKEFARSARLEKMLAARTSGRKWSDISYACGFTDQAHMINDTRPILGASPEQILRPKQPGQTGSLATRDRTPVFFW